MVSIADICVSREKQDPSVNKQKVAAAIVMANSQLKLFTGEGAVMEYTMLYLVNTQQRKTNNNKEGFTKQLRVKL